MARMSEIVSTLKLPALLAAVLLVAMSAPVSAQTPEDQAAATAVVAQLRTALLEASQQADAVDRLATLSNVVSATHDLPYIAQIAVRRQWGDFSVMQQAAFVERFSALSIASYVSRFSGVDADSFVLGDARPAGRERVQVGTQVLRSDGSAVPIEYLLQRRDDARSDSGAHLPSGDWRIVNIVADGVSDLALRRAEYRQLLEDVGIEGLLEELEDQTQALLEDADD